MTPELEFQQHIADFLEREHGYERLGTSAAIDPAEGWMADVLWSFVADTQPQALATLSGQYGSAARDEFFRALREASRQMPLWMLLRNGLMVRGISFRLYYPRPRSAQSAAAPHYDRNRLAFRPNFRFGARHEEIDLVLFLNGLPIVLLELKHEAGAQGWNVHDAVAQYARRDHAQRIFSCPSSTSPPIPRR